MKRVEHKGRGWLVLIVAASTALNGCTLFRHKNSQGCTEPQPSSNIDSRPPLRVPAGLDPPNTRNAIHIPELNEPEQVRPKSAPCLSVPPSYGPGGIPGALPTTAK